MLHSFDFKKTVLPIIVITLTACSGGGDSNVDKPIAKVTKPPVVNQPQAFDGPLIQASANQFSRYLKNGIYASTVFTLENQTPVTDAGFATSGSPSRGYSTTNTQVEGVDEADRIEYDGDYLYASIYPQWQTLVAEPATVRVLKRNEDFSLTEVNRLQVDDVEQNIDGIYLSNSRLTAIGSQGGFYALNDVAIEPWFANTPEINVNIWDVSIPEQTNSLADIQIEGWLLASRRINEHVYIVSSYVPELESLNPQASTDEEQVRNYNTIVDTPTSQLMPSISYDGSKVPLNDAEDCFIPQGAQVADGFAQLVTVTRINVSQPQDIESVCLSVYGQTLYMSESNLYIAASLEEATAFHKISLSDMAYQASGSVRGYLGRNSNPNLRIDEHQGYLRVVSSLYPKEGPEHSLSILQQSGNELIQTAVLPNTQQTETIGKPGEDIYAVRFAGDKAYVVTFERIDPLYVLSLEDPLQPVIAGSLEIPGFSSYLHPLENGYLLGVGQDVSEQNIPDNGSIPVEPPVTNGVKISLFDVRDPANPLEVSTLIKADSYTPVEYDYKSLTVLENQGEYQFAMPLETWGSSDEPSIGLWAPEHSLLMLDVDTNADSAELVELNQMQVSPEGRDYVFGGSDRSVIHGSHVYYLHGNQVWLGNWAADMSVEGPF